MEDLSQEEIARRREELTREEQRRTARYYSKYAGQDINQLCSRIETCPADDDFLEEMACSAPYPSVRRNGVPGAFIRRILSSRTRGRKDSKDSEEIDQKMTSWSVSLNALNGVLRDVTDSSDARDRPVEREICESGARIIDVIHEDLHLLTPDAPSQVMQHLAKFIFLLACHSSTHHYIYRPKCLKIAMHLWLHMTLVIEYPHIPESYDDSSISFMLDSILHPEISNHPTPSNRISLALATFDLAYIAKRINALMKDRQFVGRSFVFNIRLAATLASVDSKESVSLLNRLLNNGYYKHMVHGVRRQLRSADLDEHKIEGLYMSTEQAMNTLNCGDIPDYTKTLTEIIETTPIIEIAASGLRRANRIDGGNLTYNPAGAKGRRGSFYRFFAAIEHCFSCKHLTCHLRPDPAFIAAARVALERVLYSTAQAIGADLPHVPAEQPLAEFGYLRVLMELSTKFGITMTSTRTRYRADKQCASLECPNRRKGVHPDPVKKMMCTKCKGVYYCDRVCQKSDWSTHKRECKDSAVAK